MRRNPDGDIGEEMCNEGKCIMLKPIACDVSEGGGLSGSRANKENVATSMNPRGCEFCGKTDHLADYCPTYAPHNIMSSDAEKVVNQISHERG